MAGVTNKLYESMRHSFASQRIRAGARIEQVQELLGHTNQKTTRRYLDYGDSLREVQRGKVEVKNLKISEGK